MDMTWFLAKLRLLVSY